ncbi:CoA-binding protein [Thermococcus litoralis DSM 5473]|uniref:CoA-binding protein n=1 Tax=Thermococcus litoralis (strain ATCC 51850 / DSM 5473 / JCM 8560 / NS-C) TaxID=523849 RepID=H3ZMR9_THELN|nr:CoA-binding protein [Thermococcus litoralis]EHR78716.1 CoA-binding protein [Thermococcus litoralis DSM 5473]
MNVKEFKKIALVGASKNPAKYGNIILKDLLSKGFEVLPVNPNYDEIEGLKCYRSVKELPKDVDVIVFVVPPKVGLQVAKEAVEAGFKKLWFQPGAESEEIREFLERAGVEYSFGKCIMVETSDKKMFLEV